MKQVETTWERIWINKDDLIDVSKGRHKKGEKIEHL